MKKLIHYRSILVFTLKSIPFLIALAVVFWATANSGLVKVSLLEAKMRLSGSSINAEKNLPILARRKMGELVKKQQLPNIDFIASPIENPFSGNEQYAIYKKANLQ